MDTKTVKVGLIGGFLAAAGAGIAYLVWTRLVKRFGKKKTDEKLQGRQPGFVSNAKSGQHGRFGRANRPEVNPRIPGPYGAVGVDTYDSSSYVMVGSDARIPGFLLGNPDNPMLASGGFQDPEMPGKAPPPVLGPPPPSGQGAYWAPDWNTEDPAIGPGTALDAKNYVN